MPVEKTASLAAQNADLTAQPTSQTAQPTAVAGPLLTDKETVATAQNAPQGDQGITTAAQKTAQYNMGTVTATPRITTGSAAMASGTLAVKPAALVSQTAAVIAAQSAGGSGTLATIGSALGAGTIAGFFVVAFSAVGVGYVGYHSASWFADHIGKKAEN